MTRNQSAKFTRWGHQHKLFFKKKKKNFNLSREEREEKKLNEFRSYIIFIFLYFHTYTSSLTQLQTYSLEGIRKDSRHFSCTRRVLRAKKREQKKGKKFAIRKAKHFAIQEKTIIEKARFHVCAKRKKRQMKTSFLKLARYSFRVSLTLASFFSSFA